MSGDRLPWLKFWPADWQSDPSLRMVTLAARGLWIELLSVMHDAVPYGHLLVNGVQPNPKQIAAMVGAATASQIAKLLHELEDAGVFSRTEDGTIYSRRMVRDNVTREKSRDFGRQGGNPALKPTVTDPRDGLTPPHKPNLNGHARAVQRPEAEEEKESQEVRERDLPVAAPAPLPLSLPLWEDWQPSAEGEAYAMRLGLDIHRTLRRFRDWYLAHGEQRRTNWQAQWRIWCDDQTRIDARDAAKADAASGSGDGWLQLFGQRRAAHSACIDGAAEPTNQFLTKGPSRANEIN